MTMGLHRVLHNDSPIVKIILRIVHNYIHGEK